jgi:SAM-dependent methyltransferase
MMYEKLCTEVYDMDKKFAESDEINFYEKFISMNDLILEPMCGSGRLLIPLLQNGYKVHGVDNSASMLKSCKERALKAGVYPILFEEALETMSLSDQYNIILIPLGSFQLIYPRASAFSVLQNFKKHLLPGGKLVLDLFVPWDALYENHEKEAAGSNFRDGKDFLAEDGSTIKVEWHNQYNKYEQFYLNKNIYTKIANGEIIATEHEEMHVCWYYRYEMELILEKCGFKNIEYREEYFRNENHMIYIAENM